jgi:hypothetical protein
MVIMALLVTAGPASAIAAAPGNDETVITALPEGIERVQVTGDGYVTLTAAAGHDVVVLDYAGQPLQRVANGASVTWHDHRSHWMGAGSGTANGEPGQIATMAIPVVVDGVPATIEGELWFRGASVGWVSIIVGVVAAAAVMVLGHNRALPTAAVAMLGATSSAVMLTALSVLTLGLVPFGSPVVPALAGAALAAAIVGVVARSPDARAWAVLLAGAFVGGWAVARAGVLWLAVGTTNLALGIERVGVAVAMGLAGAGLVLTVWSGHPRLGGASTVPLAARRGRSG